MLSFSSLFIASAQAQAASGGVPPEPSPIVSLLPFFLVVAVFWFFVLRPQSKRFKEHQLMIKALKKGDRVVTGGGIIGKITKAAEESETVEVEIAPGVSVEVSRSTITAMAPTAEKKVVTPRKKAAASAATTANDN